MNRLTILMSVSVLLLLLFGWGPAPPFSIAAVQTNLTQTDLVQTDGTPSRKLSDDELLTLVQKRTLRYFWKEPNQTRCPLANVFTSMSRIETRPLLRRGEQASV